jgi:PAS domain S-box-containing protein
VLRRKYKIIGIGVILGLAVWIIDNILDYYIFYKHQRFLDLLILDMPSHEFYIRTIILSLFIVFAFYVNHLIDQVEKTKTRYCQLFDNVNDAVLLISPPGPGLPGKILEANRVACEKLGYSRDELLRLTPGDIMALEMEAGVPSWFKQLHAKGHLLFETDLVRRDGKKVPMEINVYEIDLAGESGWLSVARDITDRLKKEEEVRRLASFPELNANPILEVDASGKITFQNSAVARTLQSLGIQDGPQVFLPDRLAEMRELTPPECAQLCCEVTIKDAVFEEHIHFIPKLNVTRIYARDITPRKKGEKDLQRTKDGLELQVERRTAELAHANIELRKSEQQLRKLTYQLLTTEERERRLLSLELHDELGQDLIYLKFKLIPIAKTLSKDLPLKVDFDASFQHLDAIIDKVREISRHLSPTILEEIGLTDSIKNLFEEFCKHYNCACLSDKSAVGPDLPPQQPQCHLLESDGIDGLFSHQAQVNIYRILQESLTNISKHSQATRVFLSVKRRADEVRFEVRDNGKGFNAEEALAAGTAHNGMGLVAMQERVRMVGGAFEVKSGEGSGASLSFTIPIDNRG